MLDRMSAVVLGNRDRTVGRAKPPAPRFDVAQMLRGVPAVRLSALRFRAVGRAKPPARHFDVAQVLRGVPAGNGASISAFRQHTRVRLLPALRFRAVGRAKPPAHRFDVAQVLRGVPAIGLSAGNGASLSAFRERIRRLPAPGNLQVGSGETCVGAVMSAAGRAN